MTACSIFGYSIFLYIASGTPKSCELLELSAHLLKRASSSNFQKGFELNLFDPVSAVITHGGMAPYATAALRIQCRGALQLRAGETGSFPVHFGSPSLELTTNRVFN